MRDFMLHMVILYGKLAAVCYMVCVHLLKDIIAVYPLLMDSLILSSYYATELQLLSC
ncbi:hypothetical protein [Paenibacillus sp. 481]|uniref:hypothetical protein n=1 Tax=Paenibacillus sp. 481 TaxID=2835869 RepID=UPI001E3A0688|nr:hypothetical protein [Paenibacillus sp. 481]UHA74626.1 hypothetical protein KIK04_05950 [Paenibacillus sp. 481]